MHQTKTAVGIREENQREFSHLAAAAAERIGNKTPCFADPELWFSPRGSQDERTAARACQQCALMAGCAKWALETKQTEGVWGGLTGGERESIHRHRASLKRATQKRARALAERAARDAAAGQEALVLA